MNKTMLIATAALGLAACAANPDSIAPVSMGAAYTGVSCERAVVERNAAARALASLERQQHNAMTGDAVGVLLIGVPMSSLTGGDVGGQIGAEKGRILALDARLLECSEVAS